MPSAISGGVGTGDVAPVRRPAGSSRTLPGGDRSRPVPLSEAGSAAAAGGERLAPVSFRPGRKRRWPRRILMFANLLVGVTIVGAASAYGYLNFQLGKIGHKHIPGLTAASGPFTVLLVGSDSRAIAGGQQFGGTEAAGGQRSDTIMLARIVPAAHQITLMSIPRDLWVPIPGAGSNRINSAFNTGAPLLVQTVQTSLGLTVNHYAEVNFDTFRQIADAVGGVHVYFPTPARDLYSGLVSGQGCSLLNGNGSLAYVRSRHYEYYQDGYWHKQGESDLARVQRQQAFLKRLADKAKGQFNNPFTLNNIVTGITNNLTVDDKFSTSEILSLARTFHDIGSGNIPTETLATNDATIEGNDVLTLAQPLASQQIANFNAIGTTAAASSTTTTPASSSTTKSSDTTKAPDTTKGPAPSSVLVEVVNGSGVSGQAGTATTALSGLGYKATTVTASRAYVGASNVIHYAPDSQPAAAALAAKLTGGAQLVADPSLAPTAYSLELITGSGYAGTTSGKATSTTAPASTTTPTTTAPAPGAATDSTYVLPGTPAGQLPPASCKP